MTTSEFIKPTNQADIHSGQHLEGFYDDLYSQGYMNEWPDEKKSRVLEIINSLNLPNSGRALDFGCGNGLFTDVLKRALPGWNVYGSDLSSVAVANARKMFPECSFVEADSPELAEDFDLLFTHHVLEHVYDLPEVAKQMSSLLKPEAVMLHILPCGNAGSFEQSLCLLRRNGIDTHAEGRFFYEEPSHIRRLTTMSLSNIFASQGFALSEEFYANQFYGSVDWITDYPVPDFICYLTDGTQAKGTRARRCLRRVRWMLQLVAFSKNFTKRFLRDQCYNPGSQVGPQAFKWILKALLFPVCRFVSCWARIKADTEWREQKAQRSGSEMFLFYRRTTAKHDGEQVKFEELYPKDIEQDSRFSSALACLQQEF